MSFGRIYNSWFIKKTEKIIFDTHKITVYYQTYKIEPGTKIRHLAGDRYG